MAEADCGLDYSHDQHPFVTRDGIKICDGDLEKRRAAVKQIINEGKQRAGKEAQHANRKSKKQKALNRKNKRRHRRRR